MANKLPVWLITGASSGFGTALAETVLKAGHRVIATARNTEKAAKSNPQIESLGGKWLQLDVNDPNTIAKVDQAIREIGEIDVVVNNAGYSIIGAMEDMSEQEIHQQFNTNVYGPLRVMKGVIPHMRSRKSGTIVNISSIAGIDGRPSVSMYAASKFALEGLSEALSGELSPFGIRVLLVEPGFFRTNFLGAAITPAAGLGKAYEGTVVDTMLKAFDDRDGKQEGDPYKGASRIFEVVTGTGMGVGKTALLRLPLGPDCLARSKAKFESLEKNFQEAADIANSTNFS